MASSMFWSSIRPSVLAISVCASSPAPRSWSAMPFIPYVKAFHASFMSFERMATPSGSIRFENRLSGSSTMFWYVTMPLITSLRRGLNSYPSVPSMAIVALRAMASSSCVAPCF